MDINDIKKYITDNKDNEDVKSFVSGLYSVQGIEDFITNNSDGKRWLDSTKDKHFAKALETWKQNNLQKIIDDKVAELNPNETPEKKQLRELQSKIESMERDKNRESLKNKALTYATGKKLPISDIIDMFVGADENSTIKNIDKVSEIFNTGVQSAVEERLKTNSYIPPQQHTGNVSHADLHSALTEQYQGK